MSVIYEVPNLKINFAKLIKISFNFLSSDNCFGGYFKQQECDLWEIIVLPGLEKTKIDQSKNNCTEKPTLIGNLVNHIEFLLGGVKPS
jgi:hypothetical protein